MILVLSESCLLFCMNQSKSNMITGHIVSDYSGITLQDKHQSKEPRYQKFRKLGGSINISIRRTTGLHRRENLFRLNIFIRKTFPRWSNQVGKIIPIAGQFPYCLSLNETVGNFVMLTGIYYLSRLNLTTAIERFVAEYFKLK